MKNSVKIPIAFVYFRTMPVILDNTLKGLQMTFAKDGVSHDLGHQCPRITIFLESFGIKYDDDTKVAKLERLLSELSGNNQITSYTIRYGTKKGKK
jgi:hypothetical protein